MSRIQARPSYIVEPKSWDIDLLDYSALELSADVLNVSMTGVSTAANQTTGNTSLSNIDGKLPALISGRIPVVLPAGATGLTDTELRASAVPMSLASVPLPTGAATQATLASALTELQSILAKLNASLAVTGTFFQATQPVSAAALPLPANAAQETGGNLAAIVSAQATAANQATGNASLATLVAQTDGVEASLGSIDGKLTTGIVISSMPASASAATATAAAPTYTEASSAAFSQDLGGRLRTLSHAYVNDAPRAFIPDDVQPLSMTTDGRVRVSVSDARVADAPFSHDLEAMWGDLRPWEVSAKPYFDGSPWATW